MATAVAPERDHPIHEAEDACTRGKWRRGPLRPEVPGAELGGDGDHRVDLDPACDYGVIPGSRWRRWKPRPTLKTVPPAMASPRPGRGADVVDWAAGGRPVTGGSAGTVGSAYLRLERLDQVRRPLAAQEVPRGHTALAARPDGTLGLSRLAGRESRHAARVGPCSLEHLRARLGVMHAGLPGLGRRRG